MTVDHVWKAAYDLATKSARASARTTSEASQVAILAANAAVDALKTSCKANGITVR